MDGWILLTAAVMAATPHAHAAALDTALVERLTGAHGKLDRAAGAFKVTVPRTDLSITVQGVKLAPPSGLTSWAAFEAAGSGAMVMGDVVLTEEQVNPVMSTALDNGLEVTALHNHFLGETPRIMFMHIGGTGSVERLAEGVGKVFARLREPGVPLPQADIDPAATQLDTRALDAIFAHHGDLSGGVYKVVIGREARMHGHAIGNTMGVNTWAAFAGSDERAMVDGDFAMTESELQPVLRALRHADILVVAIHQHMTDEQPRMMFLHYWGVGRAQDLARGLRTALTEAHTK